MAFKRITPMDIFELIRRWHSKQTISQISHALGYDRKTVRKYIQAAKVKGTRGRHPLGPGPSG